MGKKGIYFNVYVSQVGILLAEEGSVESIAPQDEEDTNKYIGDEIVEYRWENFNYQ